MVQDPIFWRRFSVAVHNEEAAMLALENGAGKKEAKHAYVVSLSSPLDSPVNTPTSQCHLSPSFPAQAFTRPLTAPEHALKSEKRKKEQRKSRASSGTKNVNFDASEHGKPEMVALHNLPSHPPQSAQSQHTPSLPSTPRSAHFALDVPSSKRASRRASRFRFALSSHPPSLPPTPKSAHFPTTTSSPSGTRSKRTSRFTTHKNGSRLSLGISLTGRPKSSFRFWTTITAGNADVETSDGWLESQNRKARQRTWICWAFWLGFIVIVVGVIVTVLVLRGKGII